MTQALSDWLSATARQTARGLRHCLSLIFASLAVEGFSYTEIKVTTIDALSVDDVNWSTLSSDWRRYDDSDSEIGIMYDKSSIFYMNLTKEYAPLVGTTNVTVTRDQVTWNPISTQTKITETYKTGWVLVESGKQSQNWYKVFSITNSYYYYDSLTTHSYPSTLTSHQIKAWIVTIIKSSGMPQNPSWLAGADDGPNSKVKTASPYPVKYSWMRRYFPDASALDFDTLSMTTGANGMKVYESALLGRVPTDPNSKLICKLYFENGKPRPYIGINPYEEYGFVVKMACKKSLADKKWFYATTLEEIAQYNFFKAVVTLGEE